MSALDLLRFSGGALRGHRLRSGLSLLGVTIGVASVIVLTSLGEGARRYLTDQFTSLGTNLLIMLPGKTETTGMAPITGGVPNDVTLDDADAIARQVRAVRRVAVIGSKIQQALFPGTNPLGEFLRLGDVRFRVIGVMQPRGVNLGMDLDQMVHIPVRAGMQLFNNSGLSRVFVEVNTSGEIEAAAREITAVMRERHRGEDDITLLTQKAMLSSLGRILNVLTAAIAGIAAISLSVAGIGIMNVMLVSVSERTAEIGLLRALGASRAQILSAFLVEATILSSTGGLTGLAVGYALDRAFMLVYPNFPVEPPLWAVCGAILLSVVVGVAFGLLPARRAARLDPVVALGSG